MRRTFLLFPLIVLLIAGCGGDETPVTEGEPLAALAGRAILPADTFFPEPFPVGAALEPEINGRDLPFAQPRQQHDASIRKLERVMMGIVAALIDLAEPRDALADLAKA